MTKKNKNVNQYAVHYKSERPRGKKSKHLRPLQPEPEVSDGSKDVFILIGYAVAFCVALYAIAKALNLI